jgi:predicted nucleic acid-binding protein
VILDSSVAVKWLIPEEGSDAAALLVGQTDLFVPTLFHSELANALWKKTRCGEILIEPILPHLAELPLLVTTLDETGVVTRALELAVALNHPVYDCIYLALAEARDDVVISADLKFLGKLAGTAMAVRVKELGR